MARTVWTPAPSVGQWTQHNQALGIFFDNTDWGPGLPRRSSRTAPVSRRAVSALERGARNRPYRETIGALATALRPDATQREILEKATRRIPNRTLVEGGPPPVTLLLSPPLSRGAPLPVRLSSFVGREREVAEVRRLLQTTRLLTLTGSGGVGKSSLAIEVARSVADSSRHGALLVELAPLADPRLVGPTIAAVLGLREKPGQPILDTLGAFLRDKHLLLIVDNCEHVIAACAELVEAISRRAPGVRILATSRESLRIEGEVAFHVPSLAIPPVDREGDAEAAERYGSVRLFFECARQIRPDFTPSPLNVAVVTRICRRLDGIPLAIELAAARIGILSVDHIAVRLNDRFSLLTDGRRTALARQQTLRASLDWSHDLLDDAERAIFHRLAVFAGGFTFEAAEYVCGAGVLSVLASLVDKSLVQTEERDGAVRYYLLETVREYARERLVDGRVATLARELHRDWCLAFSEPTGSERFGATGRLRRMTPEHDNVRAALSWSLEHDAQLGLRLAKNLSVFWQMDGSNVEGVRWLERMLARVTDDPSLRAAALFDVALGARDQGDFATATRRAEESLLMASSTNDRSAQAWTFTLLGAVATERGEYAQARARLNEGLDLATRIDDVAAIRWSLGHLGNLTWYEGDYAGAIDLYERKLSLDRQFGNGSDVAWDLAAIGAATHSTGNADRARALLDEAIDIFRRSGDKPGLGRTLAYVGYLLGMNGSYAGAESALRESLLLFETMRHRPRIARSLCFLGIVAIHQKADDRGVRLVGAAEAVDPNYRFVLAPNQRDALDVSLATAGERLGDTVVAQALSKGQVMTLDQAILYALDEKAEI